MAGQATISKGYSPDYAWAQVGGAEARRDPANYYLSEAEDGGEPPGRWQGPGAEALGFGNGQEIEREPYDMLFRHRLDPRDGVTRLGKRPYQRRVEAQYARLLDAEPHATAERREELWRLAGTMCRVSPLYFDLTFSLSKSLSLFHASLGENVRRARQDDNGDAAAFWTAELAAMDAMIYAANEALLAFFQREAGYTRTGSHAARVNGRETGQWHEADLAVASWLQHTSRDGDPQLHVHNQILHAARTRRDGKWRAPDSFGYSEHAGAAAAIGTAHLEAAMTRRWGLAWAPRADGYGSEIKGISAALMEEFSSRRATIKARVARMARDYEDEHGRAPSQAQLAKMAQRANLATRKGKEHGAFNAAQLHEGWAARLAARRDPELSDVELRGIAPRVSNLGEGGAAAQTAPGPDDPAGPVLAREEEARAAQTALATLARKKSTWTRSDLIQHLWWALPGKTRRMDPAGLAALLEALADETLHGMHGPVACLEAPAFPRTPGGLRRADGRSVYQRHGGTRYAAQEQLDSEEQLLAAAQSGGAPRLRPADSARFLGADLAQLDADLREPAHAGTLRAMLPCGLTRAQGAVAHRAMTDPRRVSVILAPAGSGKTHVAGAIARAFREAGHHVFGTAPSQTATNVLRTAIAGDARNTAQFLGHRGGADQARGARGALGLPRGSVVVMDEASLTSLTDIAGIVAQAQARDWKVIVIGDSGQLSAVERGGGLRLLAGWATASCRTPCASSRLGAGGQPAAARR